MNNNKSLKSFIRIMIMFVLIFVIISSCFNGGKKKNTFKIIASTSTRSMESSIKKFAKDEEEYVEFGKTFKEGNWFHFTGDVRYDNYAKDLVYNLRTFEPIDNPIIKF